MNSDLFDVLNISKNAIELIAAIEFFFPIHEREKRESFVTDSREVDLKTINKRILELRKEYIHKFGYQNATEFIIDYKISTKKALERLFQEPLNDFKLSQLTTDDPEHIYLIHSKQPTIRFMNFLLYI